MKKNILFILLIFISANVFSQPTFEKKSLSSKAYRYKNLNQSNLCCSERLYSIVLVDSAPHNFLNTSRAFLQKEKSLFEVLLKQLNKGSITAYASDILSYNKFLTVKTANEILENLRISSVKNYDDRRGNIKEYIVQEMCFYDSNKELIQTRVTAIAPVMYFYRTNDYKTINKMILCWFYYPEIRKVLFKQKVKNTKFTVDDCFVTNKYKKQRLAICNYSLGDSLLNYYPLHLDWALNAANNHYQEEERILIDVNKTTKKPTKKQLPPRQEIKSAKIVDHIIDLQIPQNYPLYLPELKNSDENCVSLSDLIIENTFANNIIAYKAKSGDKIIAEQVVPVASVNQQMRSADAMDKESEEANGSEIKEYVLKEVQLYNQSGNLIYKYIVGICPIRWYYHDSDEERTEVKKKMIAWYKYKDLQPLLAHKYVFPNEKTQDITFDTFFRSEMYKYKPAASFDISVDEAIELIVE